MAKLILKANVYDLMLDKYLMGNVEFPDAETTLNSRKRSHVA